MAISLPTQYLSAYIEMGLTMIHKTVDVIYDPLSS